MSKYVWEGTAYLSRDGPKDYYREKKSADYRWGLFQSTRTNSYNRKVPHTITVEDIILPTHCPILGVELDYTLFTGRGVQNTKPSVDRVNPKLGYVPGNIQVISMRANRLKNNMTLSEAEAVVEYMRKNLSE